MIAIRILFASLHVYSIGRPSRIPNEPASKAKETRRPVIYTADQFRKFFANKMRPVIQVSGVRKSYGKTVAVAEASFEVNEGEIFGLIGPNGAGKTTTMECIEGLRKPDGGSIAVLGLDPFRDVYKLQNRIGVQLQQAQLQKRIKVWEAVDLWASLYRKKTADGESAAGATRP